MKIRVPLEQENLFRKYVLLVFVCTTGPLVIQTTEPLIGYISKQQYRPLVINKIVSTLPHMYMQVSVLDSK